jgi:hypothetical protein
MAAIRFYTRSNIDKLVPVYIRFQDGREIDIRLITPFRIFPSYWNEKEQALNPNIFFSQELSRDEARDIEDKFTRLKDAILREHFKLTVPPSAEWLKDVIDRFYYKETPAHDNLAENIRRFFTEAQSGTRLAGEKKKKYTLGSSRILTGPQNKMSKLLQEEINAFVKDNFNTIQADFKRLRPRERVKFYIDLLSYSLPRLEAVDIGNVSSETLSDEQWDQLIMKLKAGYDEEHEK